MRFIKPALITRLLCFFCIVLISTLTVTAQIKIRDFALWGGASGAYDPARVLVLGTAVNITGNVGSHNRVWSGTQSFTVNGNVVSGNKIELGDVFTISGTVTAYNNLLSTANIITSGTGAVLQSPGNIIARGKVAIGGGSVGGTVTVPNVTDYTGPAPAGGFASTTGQEKTIFPGMPNMPAVYFYTSSSSGPAVNNSMVLTPGIYSTMSIGDFDTVIFSGTGSYYFTQILNTGKVTFIFDANGNTTDNIKIHVAGNAHVNMPVCRVQNGAHPSRIYTEVYGNGSGGNAFEMHGQSPNYSATEGSNWVGSLWAPYGDILISSTVAPNRIDGAVWGAKEVELIRTSLVHVALTQDVVIETPAPNVPSKNKILEYMLFSGKSGQNVVDSSLYGIEALQNSNLSGGNIGSYGMVQTYVSTITGNVHSNHRVRFNGDVTVNGQVYANNATFSTVPALTGGGVSIFEMNPMTGLRSNLNIRGHISFSSVSPGSVITGQVSQPLGMTYQGPMPDSGFYYGPWDDIPMPVLPEESAVINGSVNVTSPQVVVPGSYAALILTGGTLSFSAPGDYYFTQVTNTGNLTVLHYDFGSPGIYRIFVKGQATMGRITISITNGGTGDQGKIYWETQAASGWGFSLDTDPASATWAGTVYAPNSGIMINSALGSPTLISGALWSGTKIYMSQGTNLTYFPLISPTAVSFIEPYYPPPAGGKVDTASNLIGSELASLLAYQAAIDTITENKIFRIFHDSVMIEAVARVGRFADVYTFLTNQGLTDTITNEPGSLMITGKFPIANLDTINTRPDIIDYARPLFPAINNTHIPNQGTVVSQGDKTIKADLVKRGYIMTGDSVKVGVLSDSYNTQNPGPDEGAAFNITHHDLHDSVQVIRDYPSRATDEGRAMMQIIHDVAPGSKLAFRTGTLSAGDFANGIRQLADSFLAGGRCDVIVDDITWPTEPFFRDGRVAKAVNDAKIDGVTYFSAAGNFGSRAYEANFIPSNTLPAGLTGFAHVFDTSITQKLILKQGTYMIVLQWDDEFYSLGGGTGVATDLDIYLVGFGGRRLFGFNRDNSDGDPIEVLPFTVTEDTEADLMIVNATGTGTPRFKFIIFRGDGTIVGNTTPGSTLVGQANAEGAIAVGAMLYENIPRYTPVYPAPASFSSRGGSGVRVPGTSALVVRQKPELIAPNGVNTTVDFRSENIDRDDFHNFFGTSAAAPHAAGAAALLVEAKKKFNLQPEVTPDEIRALLQSTATDMGASGYDAESGYGLVNTAAAMLTIGNPRPSIIKLYSTDSLQPGDSLPLPTTNRRFALLIKGENFIDTTKLLVNGILVPSVYIDANRIWAIIDSFSGNPMIQLVTGAKSVSGRDGGGSAIVPLWDNRRVIIISPNDITRKYGQNNPVFTSTITVNGINIEATSYTIHQLGLDRLEYITDAVPQSKTSNIYPVSVRLLLNPATDSALLADNIYQFDNPGALTIRPLPVTITPQNKTIRYGDDLGPVTYNYEFDATNISNPSALRDSLRAQHEKYLADNVLAVISGYGVPGTPGGLLTQADLENMSTMASYQSVRNARRFKVVSGKLQPLAATDSVTSLGIERLVVDVSATSLYKNKIQPLAAEFDSAYTGQHKRSFVNAQKLATGQVKANLNGELMAMVNGELMAMINGELMALVNGELMALVNGALIPIDSLFIANGELMAMVNGDSTFALNNGELMAMVNGVTTTVDISTAVQVNGTTVIVVVNGELMAMVNGELMAMVNGELMAMVNGELMAMVNGELMAIVNGELMALVNGELKIVDSVFIVNGELMAMVNGELMALVNGELMAMVNGELMALVNGRMLAMINGSTEYGIVQSVFMVNGELMAMVNDQTGLVNGELMAMVNGKMETVEIIPLPNGELMAMVNGEDLYVVNGELMALVNNELMALVNDLGFRTGPSNTKSGVIIDEDDYVIQQGSIGGMVAVNTITGLEPGVQKLIPGSFTHPHFEVSYGLGEVNIGAALVTFSAKDTSRNVTQPNPSFEVTVTGFAFGDNVSTITAPSVGTSATVGSPAGEYPITFTGGSGNGRYQLVYEEGVLTVYNKTPVTVQANTQVVNQGSALPVFTSTVSGLLNGDVLAITYTASSVNTAIAGQYTNMPVVDTTLYPQYQFTFIPAPFYVNPYGIGAKKISVKRECVKQLAQPVRGFNYMAVFSYTNTNATVVYIPRGVDNSISIASGGSFENSLPEVFPPGTHQVAVYFSGHQMYWSVRSIESFHKTAVLSDANSSTQCEAPAVTFTAVKKELVTEAAAQEKFVVAPNPANSFIRLSLPGSWVKGSEVLCTDATGRKISLGASPKVANSDLNINLSGLPKGIYFITIQTTEGSKSLKFVKQ